MSEAAAEWVAVDALTPWADNPRNNDAAVQDVADSIKRFGFASPIIARREDGEVIAGHTRLKAARRLGLDRVPVRFLDLDPTDARLLALADNKLGELADWSDGLADVLRILEEDGADLDGLGFSDEEMAELLGPDPLDALGGADGDNGPDLDVIPEDVPAITKPGDVITLGRHTLHCGDCLEVMRSLPDDSVHAVVTDPPYGIGFMGKGWDCEVPGEDFAREALRVLKPGGHLIAFAATRTVHRLAVAIENAGFEIRDQIGWLQWQGFPKSHDVSKALDAMHGAQREVIGTYTVGGTAATDGRQGRASIAAEFTTSAGVPPRELAITAPATEDAKRWAGFGTALKPAFEPAVLARKPPDGTIAANVLKHGTGALNIDACRIGYGDPAWPGPDSGSGWENSRPDATGEFLALKKDHTHSPHDLGRWPANIYATPKASRGEREEGCDELPQARKPQLQGAAGKAADPVLARFLSLPIGNQHPTVKPAKLMQWLVRLVGCQPGSIILEPFAGSGTTLVAAEVEGFTCIGIEREPKYCDIIRARVNHHISAKDAD